MSEQSKPTVSAREALIGRELAVTAGYAPSLLGATSPLDGIRGFFSGSRKLGSCNVDHHPFILISEPKEPDTHGQSAILELFNSAGGSNLRFVLGTVLERTRVPLVKDPAVIVSWIYPEPRNHRIAYPNKEMKVTVTNTARFNVKGGALETCECSQWKPDPGIGDRLLDRSVIDGFVVLTFESRDGMPYILRFPVKVPLSREVFPDAPDW